MLDASMHTAPVPERQRDIRRCLIDRGVRVSRHAIADGDPQWDRYIIVVDRLRRDAELRAAYESVKRDLATVHEEDRPAYTKGKNDVVARILRA